jgi:hypothetical protein
LKKIAALTIDKTKEANYGKNNLASPYRTWRPEHERKKRSAGKRFRFSETA